MERHLHNKIFSSTSCLSEEQLRKYNSNSLSKKEKHRAEKHLLECELCSDALEGFMEIPDAVELNKIRESVWKITAEGKVVSINYFKRFLLAAILAGIAFVPFYFLFFQNEKSENKLAENIKTETEKVLEQKEIPPNEISTEKNNFSMQNEIAEEKVAAKINASAIKKEEKKLPPVVADKLTETNSSENKIADETINSEIIAMVSDITNVPKQDENTSPKIEQEKTESEERLASAEKKPEREMAVTEAMHAYAQPAMQSREEEDSKNYEMKIKKESEAAGFSRKKSPAKSLSAQTGPGIYDDLLNEGIANFEAKEYASALEKFNRILKNDRNLADALFYSGLAHFHLGNYVRAEKAFKEIASKENTHQKEAQEMLEKMKKK